MKTTLKAVFVAVGVIGLAFVVVAYATNGHDKSAAQTEVTPTPTPYHEGQPSPVVTPALGDGHTMPLPAPQDVDTANSMTAAGIAMIQAAQSMDTAAGTMITSGIQTLVDLGQHWHQDARALRERGLWMITSATSDSMVHDADKARELNLTNLQANGMVMEAEGQAMADHAREMLAQVEQLRTDGSLPAATADDLTARGIKLIAASETMENDGKRMQEQAESLLRSLGK